MEYTYQRVQATHSNSYVREQARRILDEFSSITGDADTAVFFGMYTPHTETTHATYGKSMNQPTNHCN